jgi:DinB family protein
MKDIPDLLDGLSRSANVLSAFVQTIPADQQHQRRGDDCWTIAEHVSHLAQVQPMLLERLQRFRDEDHPIFVPYIPGEGEDASDTPEVMPMDAALDKLALFRGRQVALLNGVPAAVWEKTGSHPEYVIYSFYILARHILMHDHWHMYRMEELWLTQDAFLTQVE